MLFCDFQNYVRAIPVLRAQESLNQIMIHSYPHSKKEYQQKIHKKLHKEANPSVWSEQKKAITLDEVARMLGRG
jgi:hypothetical protein